MQKSTDDSKITLSKNVSLHIEKNSSGLCETNIPIYIPSPTNQIINFKKANSNLKINRKIKIMTFILVFIGIALISGGFVSYKLSDNPDRGIVFWIIGCLVLIPGIYYSWTLFWIWRTNAKNKVEVVKEINHQWS